MAVPHSTSELTAQGRYRGIAPVPPPQTVAGHRREQSRRATLKSIIAAKFNAWLVFFVAIYVVLVIKVVTIRYLDNDALFAVYSVAVSIYILSRFAISYLHPHLERRYGADYEPTLTFGVPCKNEAANIYETIMRIARIDYPRDKFDIIAVNDGSDDNTLGEMYRAKMDAAVLGVRVQIIDWTTNRGKRDGMAEAVKRSAFDLVVFIDSDSFIEPDTPRHLAKYFVDPKVGAVAGHAYVANANTNLITKMQAVRYFVAFKAFKAAESMFGAVTCCSGCCSAYRRAYVAEFIDEWLNQHFMGVRCTYGDDRALTNMLLRRGFKAHYAEQAVSHTFVPDTMAQFMTQQLRWKKSWVRESLKASLFIWRRHPLMSCAYYLGVLLPLVAPIIVGRALIWYPISTGATPWFYLFGLLIMGVIYGLYYRINVHHDRRWVYGAIFAVVSTLILIWQLPYAMLTLRNSRWGTR
ncbi:MAG: glycosyltransferase [Micromonosporaceae bacterium]|nr:glycosyltransferase [Micromonosporaceae bacterium]